jgi:glycosyltransferase involved in cell wall biosynthesis
MSAAREGPEPVVSVVVPTYRRASFLPGLFAALEAQVGAPGFELVIVDNASTDGTWATLADLAAQTRIPTQVLRTDENRGPAPARNLGWRNARGPLIAFTDDDCLPQPEWVAAVADGLAEADVVQGRTLPNPDQAASCGPFSRSVTVTAADGLFATCNVGYRRETVERVGGFDEAFRLLAGEDTDLAWRAMAQGARTSFRPDALVYHQVRPMSFAAAIRDSWRWQDLALAIKRHPGLRRLTDSRFVWRRSHLLVSLAAAGLAAALAVGLAGAGGWIAALVIAAAAIAPYVRYRTATAPLPATGPRRRWALLPAAFAIDLAEVVACLVGSARHRAFIL